MSDAEAVFRAWDGVRWETGVTDKKLVAIERAHGVELPASFRELWRLSDGTCAPDAHRLLFYQASDLIQPLYAPREGTKVRLLFADWQQGMATFALELAPVDCGVVVLANGVRPLAPSFDAFLALHLREKCLWPRD
jgi:hypothetical protein